MHQLILPVAVMFLIVSPAGIAAWIRKSDLL